MQRNKLLSDMYPNLVKEWDCVKNGDMVPEQFTSGSNKKVWWKCEKGHSWKTQIYVRTSGHNCPYCLGVKVIEGENDLKTQRPDLARQWDYEKNISLKPENVKCSSNLKVWWKCELGHSWRMSVAHRSAGENCPFCSGRRVLQGFNDIGTTHPQLLSEWDFEKNKIRPEETSAGSNKKVWWKCERGHVWIGKVYERVKGYNCPYCAGRRVLEGYNDLFTTHPHLLKEWDYQKNSNITPRNISAGSNKKVWWICEKGHSWRAVVYSRTKGNTGCPCCNNHAVIENYNDLKTKHPKIAEEWDYEKNGLLKPEKMAQSANIKVWWKCKKGHSYLATISNRHCGKGCPYCAGKYPVLGETDLLTKCPELCKEWAYEKNRDKKPEDYTISSNKSVWWKCSNGHYWKASIISRTSGYGCPYCSGKIQIKTRFI